MERAYIGAVARRDSREFCIAPMRVTGDVAESAGDR
jgi:hypothetical protein